MELRIAEDGEILVRGDLVMDGYWGHPADTAAAIRDGWLHTGDIGRLDHDGYLVITDRKKDMIVLSGGENVSPARVEGLLVAEPAIAQAAVFGEGRPGLAALVVAAPDSDEAAVAAAVSKVNKRLSVTERIRRHAVVPAFTLENGPAHAKPEGQAPSRRARARRRAAEASRLTFQPCLNRARRRAKLTVGKRSVRQRP